MDVTTPMTSCVAQTGLSGLLKQTKTEVDITCGMGLRRVTGDWRINMIKMYCTTVFVKVLKRKKIVEKPRLQIKLINGGGD